MEKKGLRYDFRKLIAFYCDYKLINIKGKENEHLYV